MFPRAEALLKQTDYQAALKYVARGQRMGRYRSMVDFLFCGVFPGFRKACLEFYMSGNKPLRDLPSATPQNLAHWDNCLCVALRLALEVRDQKLQATWVGFREYAALSVGAA
jgi:hypothetical protein